MMKRTAVPNTPRHPNRSVPTRLERLLARPAPKPIVVWDFWVTLASVWSGTKSTPPWPSTSHKRDGVWVQHVGVTTGSQAHHAYAIKPPRELQRSLDNDPVAMVLALAAQLGVAVHEIHCQLRSIRYAACPAGLCSLCWSVGRRRAGESCSWADPQGWHRVLDLCAECCYRAEERGCEVSRV